MKRLICPIVLTVVPISDLLDDSSPSFTSLPPFPPAYQLNTSLLCAKNTFIYLPTIRTVTKLLGTDGADQSAIEHSSLQEYPFDM